MSGRAWGWTRRGWGHRHIFDTTVSVRLCFWWKDFNENVNLAFGRHSFIEKVLLATRAITLLNTPRQNLYSNKSRINVEALEEKVKSIMEKRERMFLAQTNSYKLVWQCEKLLFMLKWQPFAIMLHQAVPSCHHLPSSHQCCQELDGQQHVRVSKEDLRFSMH